MKVIDILSTWIARSNGMKKNFLAFFLGILVTLALPPVYLFPLAIIGFSGFLLMILKATSNKDAFKIGWWFGFGHFTSGLYWIAFALLVDAPRFGWLIPFAVFGIPSVIAIYTAIVALLTWRVAKYLNGWRLIIIFACIWTVTEILRGWLFTGFPWNLAGYIWTVSDNMLQFVSIAGIYGLSLVTVLAFTMPALLIGKGEFRVQNSERKTTLPIISSFILLIGIFIWGSYRLSNAQEKFVEGINLRIVQANIPQSMKWDEEWRYSTVEKYLELSRSKGFEKTTHIIWPETALPFVITEDSPLLNVVTQIIPTNGALITGALKAEYTDSGMIKNMWNSMLVISDRGKIFSHYNKSHLVPFGEYVPFRSILPLEKITHGSIDFAEGNGVKTINAPAFPALSGLVCYEIIFPGKVVDKNKRPEVMVNVTNDAWYGKTAGPYQHFQMSRTRAVEEGMPLIRAANNGISGIIDSYGRVIANTKLASTEVLDSPLPASIPQMTIYSRYGNVALLLMVCILIIIVYISTLIRND